MNGHIRAIYLSIDSHERAHPVNYYEKKHVKCKIEFQLPNRHDGDKRVTGPSHFGYHRRFVPHHSSKEKDDEAKVDGDNAVPGEVA